MTSHPPHLLLSTSVMILSMSTTQLKPIIPTTTWLGHSQPRLRPLFLVSMLILSLNIRKNSWQSDKLDLNPDDSFLLHAPSSFLLFLSLLFSSPLLSSLSPSDRLFYFCFILTLIRYCYILYSPNSSWEQHTQALMKRWLLITVVCWESHSTYSLVLLFFLFLFHSVFSVLFFWQNLS